MMIDYKDDVWIHDGINNKIICLDKDLQEKVSFAGNCFNRKILKKNFLNKKL